MSDKYVKFLPTLVITIDFKINSHEVIAHMIRLSFNPQGLPMSGYKDGPHWFLSTMPLLLSHGSPARAEWKIPCDGQVTGVAH